MNYSGFWKRFAAFFIDSIVVSLCGFLILVIFKVIYISASGSTFEAKFFGNILRVLLGWVYFATFESSPKQATLGKRALGIKVVDLNGQRISFGKATGRYFAKFISSLLLFIGYIMAAFTEKKQGLHDKMTGCLVVNKE